LLKSFGFGEEVSMTKRSLFTIGSLLFLLHGGLLSRPVQADAVSQQIRIGVLAHRGADEALKMWTPTADYLTANVPRYSFSIVPLDFHALGPAVGRGEVNFILANSSIYVELEARYGASRIATLQNSTWQRGRTVFGGVIFCRADRNDIKSLQDLKGKSFIAVDETSLGGWQIAWRELKDNGLDPYLDFAGLRFADTTHDAVVYAVRDNKTDAGTVRTDILEQMAAEGKIDLRHFRILNQKHELNFPFLLSTRLYPEWPFAKARQTDTELAKRVAVALFNMPRDNSAAKTGKIAGWTIPLDYQPVHELLRELRLGPYADFGRITLADVVSSYWHWIVLAGAALLTMIVLTLHVLRLNTRLVLSKQLVEEARNALEQEVRVRTADLKTANEALSHEIVEHKQAEKEQKRSENLLRAVHENIEIGISLIGPDMRILSINRLMRQWFPHIDPGMSPICYQSFNDPPRAKPCSYCPTVITLSDGKVHEAVTETPTPSGVRNYRVIASPLFAADGSIEAAIEMVEDITERRTAENELKQAKEEWERTFDAISDPVMILDTNYRIIKANKAMADVLGVTPAGAVGMACCESVHGTPEPPPDCPHAQLLRDGQARSQEIFERRIGGHNLITVSPLHGRDGTLIGSIHAARNITGLKKAEELGRRYSRDLERLLSISRETTMTTDLKGLYRTFVCASQELLNLDFSTLMLLSEDKKTLTIVDCLGFPEAMIGHFSLTEGQGLSTLVVKNKKPDAVIDFNHETRFTVPPLVREKGLRSAVAVPMIIKDDVIGVLIGHTLVCRAFSEMEIEIYQLIANQAAVTIRSAMYAEILKKSEKYLRDVTASLGEGVYVLNEIGETTFMNPEAEALLGWSEKELIRKNIHDVVHNRKADGAALLFEDCEMRRIIETGNRYYSTDEVFVRKDGTVFPVSVHSRPLMENGKVVASVTAFRDISERKRTEQEREQLIAELQKALAEIKTLHGVVPICASCKKIRDDEGAWHQMEVYISEHTEARFSHGICKDCAKKLYPEFYQDDKSK
jgi:PAS domain S-box-containing protein